MNKEDQFIELYNQLDEYFRVKYFNNNPSYTSYSRKIYFIRNHKLEPVLMNEKNFDVFKKAGEIRNIISHNNDVIIPSDSFLETFKSLVKRVISPKRVDQIMTKYGDLITKDVNDRLQDAIEVLEQKGYNSIPILDHEKFIGMFTEKTLFDYLTISNRIIDKQMKISDLQDAINLDSKPRAYYQYISRKMNVEEAYQLFIEDFKNKHQLMLLLVTENGLKGENLLGIVALRDLKNVLY